MLWQGQIEGNQFQIIPDIFHPMNKPGYILIRYVDADTVTLIEFEEHMMGVAGFDRIVGKQETEEEFQERYANELSQIDEETVKQLDDFIPEAEQEVKDPREFQVAERVGDKYVFDPEICRPSTETCGQCIHGVCCEKARDAKRAAIKDTQMNAKALEPTEDYWEFVDEHTKRMLKEHGIPFEPNDYGSSYQIKFELGKHKYKIKFNMRADLSIAVMISMLDLDLEKKVGSVIYLSEVNDPESLNDYLSKLDSILEEEGVEELDKSKPTENEEC
jgi:hypothetical protein